MYVGVVSYMMCRKRGERPLIQGVAPLAMQSVVISCSDAWNVCTLSQRLTPYVVETCVWFRTRRNHMCILSIPGTYRRVHIDFEGRSLQYLDSTHSGFNETKNYSYVLFVSLCQCQHSQTHPLLTYIRCGQTGCAVSCKVVPAAAPTWSLLLLCYRIIHP